MRDDGEPISHGQVDRRALEGRALRNALFGAAFFGGVVLVNGVLFILLIGLLQALGLWETAAAIEGSEQLAAELSGRIRFIPQLHAGPTVALA